MKPVLSILLLLASCITGDDHQVPSASPPTLPPPVTGGGGGGGTPSVWLGFDATEPFGVGMAYELAFSVGGAAAPGLRFDTSDPGIATVSWPGTKRVVLTGVTPGTTKLRAWVANRAEPLAEETIEVQLVDNIAVAFRTLPGATEPVAQLAALANSTDSLAIVYRAADGDRLAGIAPISATGAVTIAGALDEQLTAPYGPPRIGIAIGAEGTGAIVATLAARELAVPIEIVPSPATYDMTLAIVGPDKVLVPPPAEIEVDPFGAVFAGIVARAADGRFVAGVKASWAISVTQAYLLSSPSNVGPDTQAIILGSGTVTIAATVGSTSLTRTVVFVPSQP